MVPPEARIGGDRREILTKFVTGRRVPKKIVPHRPTHLFTDRSEENVLKFIH